MTDLDRITQQIQLAAASIPYGGDDIEIDAAYGQICALAIEGREFIDDLWKQNRAAKIGSAADLLRDIGL